MSPLEQSIFHFVRAELKKEMVPAAYRNLVASPYCGHCHHASLAMYVLLGGKDKGYKLRKAVDELGIKHYWLENKEGEAIDPTAEQYTDLGRPLPYENPVRTGVSYMMSTAAKTIIERVTHCLAKAA